MAELPRSTIVFSEAEINAAVARLAEQVNAHCGDDDWLFLCVMNGGLVFTGELMKRVSVRMELDFVRVSRYGKATTGGELHWHAEPEHNLSGRRVLLLDDIFDDGHTLAALLDFCQTQGVAEVRSCVLLEKDHNRPKAEVRPDWIGLVCPDLYVFGYGMDYEGYYRNLADVRALVDD